LADAGDAVDAERLQRAFDGLALRIEDASLQGNGNTCLHVKSLLALHQHRAGALRTLVLHEDAEALGDFGIGLEQAAEVPAETILVELLVRLDVPQTAAIR